jgi:L-cysteine/cystine lyase
MAGIIRAVVDPSLPDPEKLAAVRSAMPSLAAGIYLNTGSVGPLPAETAAATDMEAYERDIGRAHVDYFMEFLDRMNEARAGVAAVLGTDVGAVALTHATTDGMNAATLVPDWRAGGRAVTTAHEHPGALGPLYALRDRYGSTSPSSRRATTATTPAPSPPSRGSHHRRTRLVSISH